VVTKDDFVGFPKITVGFGSDTNTTIGAVSVGHLSMVVSQLLSTGVGFDTAPYVKGQCFEFQQRWVAKDGETSDWLSFGRWVVESCTKNYGDYTWEIEAFDACGVLDLFLVEQGIGSVGAWDFSEVTSRIAVWERIRSLLAEYVTANGLWGIGFPYLNTTNVEIASWEGLDTISLISYLILMEVANLRANRAGDIVLARIPQLDRQTPAYVSRYVDVDNGFIYKQLVEGEAELPVGVIAFRGEKSEDSATNEEFLYPVGSTYPTPADGISVFKYFNYWYQQSTNSSIYSYIYGYINNAFECSECFINPMIDPGQSVKFFPGGINYLVYSIEYNFKDDVIISMSTGPLTEVDIRGSTERNVNKIVSSGAGTGSGGNGGGGVWPAGLYVIDHTPTIADLDLYEEHTIVMVRGDVYIG